MYQWKETKKEEKKKDSLGGGETTITRYEYSKIWSGTQIDSASFNQPSHSNSISVSGLNCGTEETTNSTVKYGDAGQNFEIPSLKTLRPQFWDFSGSKRVDGCVGAGPVNAASQESLLLFRG